MRKTLKAIIATTFVVIMSLFATYVQAGTGATLSAAITNPTVSADGFSLNVKITNTDSVPSGTLVLGVVATTAAEDGTFTSTSKGTVLWAAMQAGILPGYSRTLSLSGSWAEKPPGTWHLVLVVFQDLGNNQYSDHAYYWNFPQTVTFAQTAPPPVVSFDVAPGMWWNPKESGTGYNIQVAHNVLVMTIYSYKTDGTPIWYLASGNVINNTFTGTLDKYANGQSIGGSYHNPGPPSGNDGLVTVTFTSNNSATMLLPNGRTINIVPYEF